MRIDIIESSEIVEITIGERTSRWKYQGSLTDGCVCKEILPSGSPATPRRVHALNAWELAMWLNEVPDVKVSEIKEPERYLVVGMSGPTRRQADNKLFTDSYEEAVGGLSADPDNRYIYERFDLNNHPEMVLDYIKKEQEKNPDDVVREEFSKWAIHTFASVPVPKSDLETMKEMLLKVGEHRMERLDQRTALDNLWKLFNKWESLSEKRIAQYFAEWDKIPLGLYRIYWKNNGGSSIAAVGNTYDGKRWYAPCNWTCESREASLHAIASLEWKGVEKAELLLDLSDETERKNREKK